MMKKSMVIIGLGVIVGISIIIAIWNHNFKRAVTGQDMGIVPPAVTQNVTVNNWKDIHELYVICQIEDTKEIVRNSVYRTVSFDSDLTLEDFAAQNDDFIGTITYYDPPLSFPANLYFSDNNYYVLYRNGGEESNSFMAENCICEMEIGSKTWFCTLPMNMLLDDFMMEMFREDGENYPDYFFRTISFEDACEFYERFTNGIAEIDRENQLIFVDAQPFWEQEEPYEEKFLCIDFLNRRFICHKGEPDEKIYR